MENITYLLGKTAKAVYGTSHSITGNDAVVFELEDGATLYLSHNQDCCENVWLEDVVGDLEDLVDSPFAITEEVVEQEESSEWGDSSTWTFYKLSTIKGSVTIRFCGTSNGYYSERVDVIVVPPKTN